MLFKKCRSVFICTLFNTSLSYAVSPSVELNDIVSFENETLIVNTFTHYCCEHFLCTYIDDMRMSCLCPYYKRHLVFN